MLRTAAVRRLSPHMVRVTFDGPDLADLSVRRPDSQVKLLFPRPGQDRPVLPEAPAEGGAMGWYSAFTALPEQVRPWMRSYTLRSHDPAAGTADIDFVLHGAEGGGPDDGPATRWARTAAPGDLLGMFGPSDEFAAPLAIERAFGTGARILLAGDDTALPAIGTVLEHLPAGTRASVFAEVADAEDEIGLPLPEGAEVHWAHRGRHVRPGSGTALLDAVRAADLGGGPLFAWLAGEAGAVRSLRRHLVGERGADKRSIDFTGYWRRRLTQDDAPTEEDMAEARERLALAEPENASAEAAEPAPSPARAAFDGAYSSGAAPWETGRPQPAVVGLEKDGLVRGAVLDVGCGTGENALHLAERGHDVVGVDFSPAALERARAKAAARGARVRFEQADALDLPAGRDYDTVVDSALFHVFDAGERPRYTASLHRVCRPGGRVHVLALSDEGPGFGPQVGAEAIREAFGEGWELERLERTGYEGVTGPEGSPERLGTLPAWLATARRL
ncbi:SIP domain-containing protein [Nocardiopsis potens]|uniref:SIP domain-containing protein n=1 Tax=Nocardiopsis potens TaxID=1246458 RepID=UPI0003770571|nr:SIP domain-containing protein [Nocardiopsis potens]